MRFKIKFHLHVFYAMSGDDNFEIHPSSSQDVLDALVNAGIKQDVAERLLQAERGEKTTDPQAELSRCR